MMKKINYCIFLFVLLLFTSCSKKEKKDKINIDVVPVIEIPFTDLKLDDLEGFKNVASNWKLANSVYSDISKPKSIEYTKGKGILVNVPNKTEKRNIFTNFVHGDIELECDIMMPLNSNSGIYFQGRYEIQLFDSWKTNDVSHKDLGGIYERWDTSKDIKERGYEGHAPRINAAKAPGLWQHFKIIFHAPKFDKTGNKIKNAWFEEVWLNGVLIHDNVEVTGPTRGAAFNNENPRGPIMIQGDHGPVAIKNIKYKLYEENKVLLSNLKRLEYESTSPAIDNLDTIPIVKEEKTNVFSLVDITSVKEKKIVSYSGNFMVPKSGEYLFEGRTNGIAELAINGKTALEMRGGMDKIHKVIIDLKEGDASFKLVYNQSAPWARGFGLHVEGPEMQRYSLQEGVEKGADDFNPLKGITVEPVDRIITQRSFVNHKNIKRTHCISVGSPKGIHYSYDLARGSLLKVWSGSFLNTTHMWLSRGKDQLGEPIGFSIAMHGDLEFASLTNEESSWPMPLDENKGVEQLGYVFDSTKNPEFSYKIEGATIKNKFTVSKENRQLNKLIKISSDKTLWHKVADGESIKALPNNTYIVNDESYYVDFIENEGLKPIIRNNGSKYELLIKVPKGNNTVNYNIVW